MEELNQLKKDVEYLKSMILTLISQQNINKLKILSKEDLLELFPWESTKMTQLIQSNQLPLTKIGNDYITTEKQIQKWLEDNEGLEIVYK